MNIFFNNKMALSSNGNSFIFNDYMKNQTEITTETRTIIVGWIIEVHDHFKFSPEVLYRTVDILDRFLSHMVVYREKFQLVAIGAFLLALKLEEDNVKLKIKDFSNITDYTYSCEEIQQVEMIIANILDFNLHFPTRYDFIDAETHLDESIISLVSYILERSLLDYDMIKWSPSTVTNCAILISMNLENISELSSNDDECVSFIKKCIGTRIVHAEAIYKKYPKEHSLFNSLV
jgi:hypothetical protein